MTATTFVAAGASSTTDGGTAPTPGLPAGLVARDLMVALFYSREATDGAVFPSSGWTPLYNARTAGGLLGVWYRQYQAGDVAITFTLSGLAGGAGGDDALAQIAAWREADAAALVSDPFTNVAATNIGPIPGLTLAPRETVLVVGGKLDDYTSVATLSGDGLTWAEIAEVKSTAGTDAGMIWDYAINGESESVVTAKTFTVTGGTAVAGVGVMVKLLNLDNELVYRRKRMIHRQRVQEEAF